MRASSFFRYCEVLLHVSAQIPMYGTCSPSTGMFFPEPLIRVLCMPPVLHRTSRLWHACISLMCAPYFGCSVLCSQPPKSPSLRPVFPITALHVEASMASRMKPKQAPQPWAPNKAKKNVAVHGSTLKRPRADTDGNAPAKSQAGRRKATAGSSAPTAKSKKKLLPPIDACTEVIAEHNANSARTKPPPSCPTRTVGSMSGNPSGVLPPTGPYHSLALFRNVR